MDFHPAPIDGVIWKPLQRFVDPRGWLCELFRHDEMPATYHPVMAYFSMTAPGVGRGPHEHREQADYFCFLGPGNFKVYLWDNRADSPSYRAHQTDVVGQDKPMALIVPPGVVHGYENVSDVPGLVFNAPNRLYRGPGKSEAVDEIRHESMPGSAFRIP
jgi:dTDP-4-dehydrorhamnose 3,5-epimerase